jgi:hypothetical protein
MTSARCVAAAADLMAIAFGLFAIVRGLFFAPPDLQAAVDESPIIAFPLEGEWKSVDSPGHHRFAYDFMLVRNGSTRSEGRLSHVLGRLSVEDVHGWSTPVYAPVDGTVVVAADGWPDREQLSLIPDTIGLVVPADVEDADDLRPFAGNHVVIEADGGYFVLLAHLRQGSIQVSRGDRVAAGDQLGEIGNSGRTLEPHLHLELVDSLHLPDAETLPFRVANYERWSGEAWDRIEVGVLGKDERIRTQDHP